MLAGSDIKFRIFKSIVKTESVYELDREIDICSGCSLIKKVFLQTTGKLMEKLKFRQIRMDDLPVIMNWRMLPHITKYMCTDPQLTMDDQVRWYQKSLKDDSSFYWIFEAGGRTAGMVSLVQWDKTNSVIHSGAYIAEQSARSLQNIIELFHISCYNK